MTSRRPMTRTYSGSGRTSSFNEEDGNSSNGRSESRNTYLSNVRPENRSTLCSVMAQLTEDIQPSFETTLKSKAVSENCNVKFTCVVSGYPAPELKWYKDDMEMDRYCGLPKYEIRRNGKTHTLHIYNCTLDDAAIYQVSASNSKGIVSCSGVLEVGTMNEYQIHQRFFAKLKEKAEKKKNDMTPQAKKEDKENVQKETKQSSPERPVRKRHAPPPAEKPAAKQPERVNQPAAAAEPNGVSPEVKESAPVTSKDSGLDKETPPGETTLSKKKMKISNGVDAAVNGNNGSSSSRSHMMGNGGENCYDGGISLAQFLAETLQSQAAEDKQSSHRGERPKEMDACAVSDTKENEREQERLQREREGQDKALEEEREKKREEEMAKERERERARQSAVTHTVAASTKHGSEVKHHSKAHKDHDHHNIQASISSMIHSVKDFLFGKNKKDSHDHIERRDREFEESLQPPPLGTPPSYRLRPEQNQVSEHPAQDVVAPMEVDEPTAPGEAADIEQQPVPQESHAPKHEDSGLHTNQPLSHVLPSESVKEGAKETGVAVETMEVSVGPENSSSGDEMPLSGLQGHTEAESEVLSVIKEDTIHKPGGRANSPRLSNQNARDESSPAEDMTVLPQTPAPDEEEASPTSTVSYLEESWTPPDCAVTAADSNIFGAATTETMQVENTSLKGAHKGGQPDFNQTCEGAKPEVKSDKEPHLDINRSEITELVAPSLEERIESCDSETPELEPSPPLPDMAACRAESAEEIEQTSLIQEMNVGFLTTVGLKSTEMADLKLQQECNSSVADESTVGDFTKTQSSNSDLTGSEEKGEIKDVLISELEKDVEVNNLETREAVVLAGQSESEVETEKIDDSKSLSGVQNKECNAYVLEETNNVVQRDNSVTEQGWTSETVPYIHISTIEDVPDSKPIVAEVKPSEHFVIPKIEVMEPELKESTLPLTILALNKQELEPAILQKHDVTGVSEVIIQQQEVADPPGLLPTQKGTQLGNGEEMKEVAQSHDKTELFEPEQPHVVNSEQFPQTDFTLIPVISVSCTDDMVEDVHLNTHISDMSQPAETPTMPLFVVPPISVTCHESDTSFALATHSLLTETETPMVKQSGTHDENKVTAEPEKSQSKKQNTEVTDKSMKDNDLSNLYESLVPKDSDSVLSISKPTEESIIPEILRVKPIKDAKIENSVSVEDIQRNRPSVDRLCSKPPTHPSLSPASLRKFMSRAAPDSDTEAATTVPVITVSDRQSDKTEDDLSGGSTPTSSLSCESSPRLKRRDSLSLIRSATPEELASGARRKIFIPKPKDDGEGAVVGSLDAQTKKETPYMSPSQARRAALLQAPTGQNTPPMERRSPLLSRRKITLEVPKVVEETPKEEPAKQEEKAAENKLDPLKAPQVIRKIRGEPFADASGHLKLWCQFFNVLSDSTIKWYRDEEEILELKRSGGDETQVALAIVLADSQDCGVYGCSISNEYGSDTTDFLLSVDILAEILLRDDLEVGEEIEMTPLLFTRGLADCGNWGEKYFGRIMTEAAHVGEGCAHKASSVKVIYGLDPIFESGSSCIIKVQNPIAYGTKQESNLAERNMEITKQECKVQNMIREYCKIFAAEARVIENFGPYLEVIPQYLIYRPANSVPYATVEADLKGVFLKYCMMDPKGRLITQTISEVEQKCSTFQHWIHQWTHGNLLVTRMEGVEMKITNVRVVTKSKGYQGLTEKGSPEVFEQFLTHHQCNYYCGLLGLHPLHKSMDSLQPTKIKGSRSPLLNRKLGSNSPQTQRKGQSPQLLRKANSSPKVTRKVQEDNKSGTKPKPAEATHALEMSYQSQQGLGECDQTCARTDLACLPSDSTSTSLASVNCVRLDF